MMGAHFIGEKKIKQLSRRFGIDIVAGINQSGTKRYEVLTSDDKTYLIDVIDGSIVEIESDNKPSLRRQAFVDNIRQSWVQD